MIYDGRRGYLSGDLSQATGTVLAMTKGPIKDRNWFSSSDPVYSITISSGASGAVALEGTNDVAFKDSSGLENNSIERDFLPTEGASWTPIQAATSTSATGTITQDYQFLRLRITTSGTGFVTQAWVKWN